MIEMFETCDPGAQIDLGDQEIGPFNIRNLKFDPAITVKGGRFFCPSDTPRCFRLNNCTGIHFVGGRLQGSDRSAGGFLVDGGSDVRFRSMEVSGLKHGIAHRGVDGFEVSDCSFSDMRIDAIRGGGSSRVLIARNHATNFFPIATGGSGDHPDFIQFWPLADYAGNDDITVIDNVFEKGDGLPVQGVFMRGIYPSRPRFGRVVVRGNRIEGGLRNGIMVSGASGEVCDNVVVSLGEPLSALRIEEFSGEVRNNCARRFVGDVPEEQNHLGEPKPQIAARERRIILQPGETLIVSAP